MSAAMIAALSASEVRLALIYEGAFNSIGSPSGTEYLRYWTGYGDLSWDGETWLGAGELLALSPIEESQQLKAIGFNVTLSGLPSALVTIALQTAAQSQGQPGKVWLAVFSTNIHPNPLDLGSWATVGWECTLSRDTSIEGGAGGVPLKMVTTNSDPYTITYNGSTSFNLDQPASAGQTWRMSVWAKGAVDSSPEYCEMYLFEINANGDVITFGFHVFEVTTEWQEFSFTYQLTDPSTTNLQCRVDGPSGGSPFTPRTVWFDGLKVELVNETYFMVETPYLVQQGKLDIAIIENDGQTCSMSMNYESRLIELEIPRTRRYTDEDQRIDYPSDEGFKFVTSLQNKDLNWGG